jgi:hypothetical protein
MWRPVVWRTDCAAAGGEYGTSMDGLDRMPPKNGASKGYPGRAELVGLPRRRKQETEMSQDGFAGIWKQVADDFDGYWGTRSGNPLSSTDGTPAESCGSIEERYGISPEEAVRRIKDFGERSRNWDISTW